ncbi:hypothetical protein Tco_0329198 [Tanacetum coccineum]
MGSTITNDGTRGTESGKERFMKFSNYMASFMGSAFTSTHFDRPKESGIKDLFGGEICTVMSPDYDNYDMLDNEIPRMVVCEICKPWGTINMKSNRSKSFEGKCLCDFLVLEFILMRVLKSGKMISGQILFSFFVSDDNIEFLEQKDSTAIVLAKHPF